MPGYDVDFKRSEYLTLHILSANNNDRAESDSSNETLNQIQIDTNESFMEMKREREKIMSSAQNWFSTVASRARVDDYFNHHYVR